MLRVKNTPIILAILFFIGISPCFSVIVVDIEPVDFPYQVHWEDVRYANGQKDLVSHQESSSPIYFTHHLRITFFDTEFQRFVDNAGDFPGKVYYLSIPDELNLKLAKSKRYSVQFKNWFSITYSYKNNKFIMSLNVSDCKTENMNKVIRCKGKVFGIERHSRIDLAPEMLSDETRPYLNAVYVLSNKNEPIFPSNQYITTASLQHFLSKNKARKNLRISNLTSAFFFYDSHDPTLKTVSHSTLCKREMEKLGELAADITMQWLGCTKKDGKYKEGSSNGFDGVYTKDGILILSESKFYTRPPSLNEVINGSLYSKITTRLNNIDKYGNQRQKKTAKFIRDFFENSFHQVYLLAYVVLPNGEVKSEIDSYQNVHQHAIPIKPRNPFITKYDKRETEDENLQIEIIKQFRELRLGSFKFINLAMKTFGYKKNYASANFRERNH